MRFPRSCYTSLNNVLKTIHLNENEMITLNLGIGDGDIDRISFKTPAELDEYILEIELSDFDSVWLITQGGENSEIFVTEDLHIVRLLLHQDYFFGINTISHTYFITQTFIGLFFIINLTVSVIKNLVIIR